MKGKKYKRSQRVVHSIYEKAFGLRQPYQVLVDASFCIAALENKITTAEAFANVFGGQVKPMTTPCIQHELLKYDSANNSGAVFVSRRFEMRRCQHPAKTKSGTDCIRDLIGDDNPFHYCVASQDPELKRALRCVPGVPHVMMLRDTVVMATPTAETLRVARQRELDKLRLQGKLDAKMLQIETSDGAEGTEGAVKKKRKKRNPNPLSCKKPKKRPQSTVATGKKPRKRRSKKTLRAPAPSQ